MNKVIIITAAFHIDYLSNQGELFHSLNSRKESREIYGRIQRTKTQYAYTPRYKGMMKAFSLKFLASYSIILYSL